MQGNAYHVVPHTTAGWDVMKEGARRASFHSETQKEAIDKARNMARKERTELIVHGRNGAIRTRDSYGHDPYPPRG